MGHDVTVFEALHELGGVLIYGIPQFRLPKEIVKAEIDSLKNLGVEFVTNAVIGFTDTIDELMQKGASSFSEGVDSTTSPAQGGYDAVFIAVGAGLPYFLNIPGENFKRSRSHQSRS